MCNIFGISLFIIAILCVNNADSKSKKIGLDIKGTIEKLLAEFKEKIPEEFNFSDREIVIPQNKYLDGTLNLNNMSLSGVKEFNATILYRPIVAIPKEYKFTLENLSLSMAYKSNITIFNLPYLAVFGEGKANIALNNLKVEGKISPSFFPINVSTTADINLEGINVDLSGLLNDDIFSKQFGTVVGKSVLTIFEASRTTISRLLTNMLNYAIQLILSKPTTQYQLKNYQEFNEEDVQDAVALILQDILNEFVTSI